MISCHDERLEATLRGYRAFVAGRHGWQLGDVVIP
jgi:hypothetical protein